jgi:hypothetical protein
MDGNQKEAHPYELTTRRSDIQLCRKSDMELKIPRAKEKKSLFCCGRGGKLESFSSELDKKALS